MKTAVVGCGAVGSFYGARLCRAGHEVHFLLRSDYESVRRNGVVVHSPEGDFQARPRCARSPDEIGPSELVLIALKTTANDQFEKLLPPLVGPATTVLTLQNGLGNEEQLARCFPASQIMGGLCFVCLNRVEPGVIHHLAHGKVILGEFEGWPQPRTHDIATMFRHAGVPCAVTDSLARAHWEKLTWNIPFNGLGVASAAGLQSVTRGQLPAPIRHPLDPCLSTDQLLGDSKWEHQVRALMLEIIAAARGLGFALEDALADKMIERTRDMGAYKASTLIDFERGQPLEMESLFLEPLRQAKRTSVPTPRLAALCEVLRQLNCAR